MHKPVKYVENGLTCAAGAAWGGEEKARARDALRQRELENQKMAALYREPILGEKPPPPLVQVQARKPSSC